MTYKSKNICCKLYFLWYTSERKEKEKKQASLFHRRLGHENDHSATWNVVFRRQYNSIEIIQNNSTKYAKSFQKKNSWILKAYRQQTSHTHDSSTHLLYFNISTISLYFIYWELNTNTGGIVNFQATLKYLVMWSLYSLSPLRCILEPPSQR
jgi:hypothetical protein